MIGTLLASLGLLISGGLAIGGYFKTRQFVREKLRFVDMAHKPAMPLVAGAVTWIAASAVAGPLPLVGWVTALAIGAGVGLGVKHGSNDSKRLPGF